MINGVPVRYCSAFPSEKIFGMIGLKGFGPNSWWDDWTDEGVHAYKAMTEEFIMRYDAWTGHFTKLTESIKKEGFRNPVIVTIGKPRVRSMKCVPPRYTKLDTKNWIFMEGNYGGSRLWVAQQLGMSIPVIMSDFPNEYPEYREIGKIDQLYNFFKDIPEKISVTRERGIEITQLPPTHMGENFDNGIVAPARELLLTEIYNKHYHRKIKFNPLKFKKLAARVYGFHS